MEQTRLSSASDDEVGGFTARSALSEAKQSNTEIADPKRPGSRAAVLDERASGHALSSGSERGRQRLQGAILASGACIRCRASSSTLELRASEIARRRTEEKRAEAFFPLRETTTAADPKRDARAAQD
jgi:hypothetical protein